MITDTLLIFDNLKQKVMVIANVFLDGQRPLEEAYGEGQEKIKTIIAKLQSKILPLPRQKFSFPSPLALKP